MLRKFAPAAALLALAFTSPVVAQTLAPGEIELHIEGLGDTPADTAVIPVQLTGRGDTAALAKADLAKKEKDFYAALAKLGIPRSKVEVAKEDEPSYAVIETAVPYECVPTTDPVSTDTAASDPIVARPVVTTVSPDCPKPQQRENLFLFVTVEDLSKLPELSEFVGETYYTRSRGHFYARDQKAAYAAAVAEAIANARAEAETYAAAMGYRVVRMVRVGNAKPKINWPDLMMMFGGIAMGMASGGGEVQSEYDLRAMAAGQWAGVTIDFVIAPK